MGAWLLVLQLGTTNFLYNGMVVLPFQMVEKVSRFPVYIGIGLLYILGINITDKALLFVQL